MPSGSPAFEHARDAWREFDWRGRRIAWQRWGDGPPLVLLHGTPWSSALWMPIAEQLGRRFTVHVWDMPGYGRSSKAPEHAVDLVTQGEAFAALLDHWGLAEPHVIAHDIGGAVALRARLRHGVHFASLCLVDVVALTPWGSDFYRLVAANPHVFAQLPDPMHRAMLDAYIGGASAHPLDDRAREMLASPWWGEAGRGAFARQIAAADESHTRELEDELATIEEPVHIVWGAEDAWIPVERARQLHAMMPGSSLRVIEDAGHLIQLDAPDALAADLAAWTESVRA